jgi:hypothetical protein
MRSTEAKRGVVDAMIQKGLIADPKKAFELLDVKGLEEYMEDEYIDERQAQRIIDLFKQGKAYIAVSKDDNHDIHFKVFNNFRKTEEFDILPEKIQGMILKRIEEHKSYMAQATAAAAPQPQVGVPGVGTEQKLPDDVLNEAIRQELQAGGMA